MIRHTPTAAATRTHITTLVDLLRWRSTQQPDARAFTFLADGDTAEVSITYAELDRQARTIGAMLQQRGATGERVLLLYPSGLEYIAAFFGCLYAGAVAVTAYPPRFHRSLDRLAAIVTDARPTLAMTTAALLSKAELWRMQAAELETLPWLATALTVEPPDSSWQAPDITAESLAFLQYTSGSTGAPKGVMLTHDNLLSNVAMLQHATRQTTHAPVVGWLPLYHDMGLIGTILYPISLGRPCVLMSPVAFLQRPFRWLQTIARFRASVSVGPNFAYDLCIRKITPAQRATLDLHCWEMAFNGAEPVRAATLTRFTHTFAACGLRPDVFYPCYGLAEATLIVSGGRPQALPVVYTVPRDTLEPQRMVRPQTERERATALIGCGQALLEQQQIRIVDPVSCTHCPPDQIGEIWVAGPSVAQGYWHRPQATAETFQAFLADSGEGPFLRTGDLGFFHHGELFITGRMKDVMIIRGSNHYPQDIEMTVEQCHPSLRPGCGAAFTVETAGEERLVVVHEVERHVVSARAHVPERCQTDSTSGGDPAAPGAVQTDPMMAAIRQAIAEQHGLQVFAIVLLKPESLPKTSSGKLQRYACRAGFLAQSLEAVDAWQATLTVAEPPSQSQAIPGLRQRAA